MMNLHRRKKTRAVLDEIKRRARLDEEPGWSEAEWREVIARAVVQQPQPAGCWMKTETAKQPYLRPVFWAAVVLLATLGGAFFLLRQRPPAGTREGDAPGSHRAGEMLPADPARLVRGTEPQSIRRPTAADGPVFTWISPGTGLKVIWFFNEEAAIVASGSPGVVDQRAAHAEDIDVGPDGLQFTIRLLVGGRTAENQGGETLENDPIIRELRTLLKYETYRPLDAGVLRTSKGEPVRVLLGRSGEYELSLRPKYDRDEKSDSLQCFVRLRRTVHLPLNAGSAPRTETDLISTSLGLKPGEKTVIGVSKSGGDKALILILSGGR